MSARSLTRTPAFIGEPIAALNITPLIDVLLVLLVMMILTVPAMMSEVPVDLPAPSDRPAPASVVHRIDIAAAGSLAWDGAPIAAAALPARLAAVRSDPAVQVQIRADADARYDIFDQTLATIKRAGITRLGFVGNERFADFGALLR